MTISVLSQEIALSPGADLWIVPDLKESHWTKQIDWHLNFQISKAHRHSSPEIQNFLNEVLAETELERFDQIQPSKYPLMIASEKLLPNKWVVILPWNKNASEWCDLAFRVWADLKQPSLRLFIPKELNPSLFEEVWAKNNCPQDYTLVLD